MLCCYSVVLLQFCVVYLCAYISLHLGQTEDEVKKVVTIMQNPRQYKIPDWFLNRQKDSKEGKYSQVLSNGLDNVLREDLERLKKIRAHRGIRHYWG